MENINFFPTKKSKLDVKKNIKILTTELERIKEELNNQDSQKYQDQSFIWFTDNTYLIEEQLSILHRDFPQRYCNSLPQMMKGSDAGIPNIYVNTKKFVDLINCKIDLSELENYLKEVQKTNVLTQGEIWAIPTALRLNLLEELVLELKKSIKRAHQVELAEKTTEELFEIISDELHEKELEKFIMLKFKQKRNFTSTYAVEILARLRDQDASLQIVKNTIEQLYKDQGKDIQEIIQSEQLELAKNQIKISNIINGLRNITKTEWHNFFARINPLDEIFSNDFNGQYNKMDKATKDHYRAKIEQLSRKSKVKEIEIAKKCLRLSSENKKDIGFYLFKEEKKILKKEINLSEKKINFYLNGILKNPEIIYFSLICVFVIFGHLILTNFLIYTNISKNFAILLNLLFFIPITEFSTGVIHTSITQLRRPRILPKMDFNQAVPEAHKTMVVIPCLLINKTIIDELIKSLELHYLSNKDENIYFSLLGDLVDHEEEHKHDDRELIDYTKKKILNLNGRHKGKEKFFFYYRKRVWNKSENSWIAYERKRGKISEFNQLTRGNKNTTFINDDINWELLKKLKYIITLDADTQLPIGAAKKMIGTIAHPLNQPVLNETGTRIVSGHAIIQPRISVSMTSSIQTRFAQIFSGNTGLDPYTTAVSDIYQDFFGEGNYTGKGLYDIDAFEKILDNLIPENTILSHDLFEGCLARTGLATDIELYDDYPQNFNIYAKRNHRWIRGDWQLLPWIGRYVRDKNNKKIKNPITILGRWKILDNLRRSLLAPITLLSLFGIWLIKQKMPLEGTVLLILFVNSSLITASIIDLVKLKKNNLREHLKNNLFATKNKIEQIFLMIVYLPEMSLIGMDAIIRALYRSYISKEKKLEWVTFSQIQRRNSNWKDLISFGPLCAFIAFLSIYFINPKSLIIAFPFISTWLLTPYISLGTQKKIPPKYDPLNNSEISDYRRYARITWHFFERFVNNEGNWLAPDNFQENPKPKTAYRTSPTNIGLQLLSTLSAFDLNFISLSQFLDITEKTLKSLQSLEKHNGHLFNWYDTKNLSPLNPKYISTVDSGNLAVCLITLKQGVLELSNKVEHYKKHQPQIGIKDTLSFLKEKLERINYKKHTLSRKIWQLCNRLQDEVSLLSAEDLLNKAKEIEQTTKEIELNERLESHDEIHFLAICLIEQCIGFLNDKNINLNKTRLKLKSIAYQAHDFAYKMDFNYLFDNEKMIFSIGQHHNEVSKDTSYYDLLASEARLASFFAIAKGDIPTDHWFRLGRQMVKTSKSRVLVSWSATMFEYLMPILVMRRFEDTLLDQTYESVVKSQINFGKEHKIPWGISESGYHARDLDYNYQYSAFGIPDIGLKNINPGDIVVSPYSTMLAAVIAPHESLENLKKLERMDALGPYGFYESIDFSASRIPKNKEYIILNSFMAHHQGMSLISLNNMLNNYKMQDRFHSETSVESSQILLQERAPLTVEIKKFKKLSQRKITPIDYKTGSMRKLSTKKELMLETQLLSNGKLSLLINGAGNGYLKLHDAVLGRWNPHELNTPTGQSIQLHDNERNLTFSFENSKDTDTRLITGETTFTEDKVSFSKEDSEIFFGTTIIISSEENVEIRKISVTNKTDRKKDIEIATYQELSICPVRKYNMHPAFHNLFIKTKYLEECQALIATREKGSNDKQIGFQLLTLEKMAGDLIEFETDRSNILRRGEVTPLFFSKDKKINLQKNAGAVIDPVFSFKIKLKIAPNSLREIYLVTGLTADESDALRIIKKYKRKDIFEREFTLSWITSQNTLNHLKVETEKAIAYQKTCGFLFFSFSLKKSPFNSINTKGMNQNDLWSLGISGDLPILTLKISNDKDLRILRDLIHAHEYISLKGHCFDFIIINEEISGYLNNLKDEIIRQIIICGSMKYLNKNGGIFIVDRQLAGKEKVDFLLSISSITFIAGAGNLSTQIARIEQQKKKNGFFKIIEPKVSSFPKDKLLIPQVPGSTILSNSFGAFDISGKAYIIHSTPKKRPPLPWVNIISNNPHFGFLISDLGQGFTWGTNSRQNRLSKWSNDPLRENISEVIFIKDLSTGVMSSPTPSPFFAEVDHQIRHEAGITTFISISNEIKQTLKVFTPVGTTFKIIHLELKNTGSKKKDFHVGYLTDFQISAPEDEIRPLFYSWDELKQVLWVQNSYQKDFSDQFIFLTSSRPLISHSLGKDSEGISKNFLNQEYMLNSYALIESEIDLIPQEEKSIHFFLGHSTIKNKNEIDEIKKKFNQPGEINNAITEINNFWDDIQSVITIETPDKSLDILFNNWLLYQTLACRIWARSAFYQSGGAYGFRDQLQDVMALTYSKPELTRGHILLAASRQFTDGDVQHWWHTPGGQGVRTKFSDDLLWLPYVVSFYVKITGDYKILDTEIPFLTPKNIPDGHDEFYFTPEISNFKENLYGHCLRALKRSLKTGPHGLPLMGSGDWNDGMNKVGHKGIGESVWMCWFLMSTLENFLFICEHQKDEDNFNVFKNHIHKIQEATEQHAWDGDWYIRAYFDDGTKLGSKENLECQIDSIAQSWAVLSRLGQKVRSTHAIESAYNRLVDFPNKIIKLFDPPFEKTQQDPGYIKNYLPGVRENGGQYTHASIWLMMAFAEIGDSEKTWNLLKILNPINHSLDQENAEKYKLEPYVIAADIYGSESNKGRGGWSWYTGSSGWFYRAILESFIGFKLQGHELSFRPCLPHNWTSIKVIYQYGKSSYHISLHNHESETSISIDGAITETSFIHLKDEARKYEVNIKTPFSKAEEQSFETNNDFCKSH